MWSITVHVPVKINMLGDSYEKYSTDNLPFCFTFFILGLEERVTLYKL